jgi:hypothetical protein
VTATKTAHQTTSPVKIDVQDIEKPVPALLVPISSNRVKEVRDDNVSPNNGVHRPLSAEV